MNSTKSKYYGTQKLLLRLATLAVLLITSLSASAQRGEKTLGIAAGYASYNNSGSAAVYFQYGFAQHVRIAPEIGCVFRNQGKSAFLATADMHFPFTLARGFNIYPLAGLTFNSWSRVGANSYNNVGLDFGGGLELYMTSKLKFNVQAKYSLINKTSGAFASFGIGYVF